MVTAAETASGARPEPATAERPSAERSSPPSPRPRRPAPAAAAETESLDVEAADGSLAETGAESTGAEPPQRRALTFFGSVIAPTTVLTALLFYFGMLHADWFFRYFGVNYTVLGLTTQDFLLRSADGLFVPLTVAAGVVLLTSWGFRSARRWVPERVWNRVRTLAGPVAAGLGTVLVLVAVLAMARPAAFAATLGLPGLCLAVGVLFLASVSPLLRLRHPNQQYEPLPTLVAVGEWAACFLLVSVGLFWAAGDYSAAVGTGRGAQVAAELPTSPTVVVYSEKSLGLRLPGVVETRCRGEESAYAFRYDGLKLVMQAGDRYMFLPAQWRDGQGTALVIPRTDSLRLDFSAPGQAQVDGC